jgi:hypothetical protein
MAGSVRVETGGPGTVLLCETLPHQSITIVVPEQKVCHAISSAYGNGRQSTVQRYVGYEFVTLPGLRLLVIALKSPSGLSISNVEIKRDGGGVCAATCALTMHMWPIRQLRRSQPQSSRIALA